jgi:pantoate--beta-alanine ligase
MKTVLKPNELQALCLQLKSQEKVIGFVPTMGALHEGHLSLLREARKNSDVVIASIFVNPTQFNNPQDFINYPNTLRSDLTLLENESVDIAFTPNSDDMYADGKTYFVHETTNASELCGKTRPGHFDGVLTVMIKLLQITQANKVFMGEKDYQQLQLIQNMANAFFIPTEIIGCATVRDEQGLALSSRNKRLNSDGLDKAHFFARTLKQNETLENISKTLEQNNIRVDYLEEKYGRRFAAVFIDDVRLIDNVQL